MRNLGTIFRHAGASDTLREINQRNAYALPQPTAPAGMAGLGGRAPPQPIFPDEIIPPPPICSKSSKRLKQISVLYSICEGAAVQRRDEGFFCIKQIVF